MGAGVGSSDAGLIHLSNDKKVYEYTAPTASRLFSIFILGGKRKLEVLRKQDKTLTVDNLLFIGNIADKDWVKSNSEEQKKDMESTIAFPTIAFFVSL